MGVKEIAYRLRKEKEELVVKIGELHRESENLFNTTEQFIIEHDLDEDHSIYKCDLNLIVNKKGR